MITIVPGEGSQGVYTQDRNICILGADTPIVYLLPRRSSIHVCTQLYTCVYTTVYTRVHNIALSMSSVELLYTALLGATPSARLETRLSPPRQEGTPQGAKE